jgi:dihydropyrimidinase
VILRGGLVVTPGGTVRADVVCGDGRIAELRPADSGGSSLGGEIVDVSGCYVLPGGVDPHSHLMSGLAAASHAALLGGTTTALSFSLPRHGETTVSAFSRAREQVDSGESLIDIGLHAMCYRPNELDAEQLAELVELGADAIKIFLAYPELGIMATGDSLYRVMTHARRLGIPVQVHCEDGELVEALVDEAVQAASVSADGSARMRGRGFEPTLFAAVRPPVLEDVAVDRALTIAGMAQARVYITHLSSAGAIEHVRRARAAGRDDIHAEACLHHLLLDEDEYAGPAAGELLVAPPLRPAAHVDAVRAALVDGMLDTLGSDHSQSRTPVDERICPCGDAAYGIAGIGARLPLLLSWGLENGVPIERLAHLLATGPADAFGYGAQKGRIAVGADADLVVWNPHDRWTVGADSFPDGTGTAPYLGRRVSGRVTMVVRGGRVGVRDGQLIDPEGRGRRLVPNRVEPTKEAGSSHE